MNRTGGYTLLEMVVVVALIALATGMVAPAGYRMLASWQEAHDVDQVFTAIHALPVRARAEGRQIVIDTAPQGPEQEPALLPESLPLPDGWSLQMQEPLVIRANGACSPASGTLHTARQQLAFRVASPFCRIERVPAGEA